VENRGKSKNRNKMRNLAQFRGMTDEEFEDVMGKKEQTVDVSRDLETRIQTKMEEFSKDYDLSDLKINDREVLRGLIQNIIAKEDYEQYLFKIRAQGFGDEYLSTIDKIQKVTSDLEKAISNAQNDLNITRKIRKSDQETSVIAYLESLKSQARRFIESRNAYIFCPRCKTLLATTWVLYWDNENEIRLTCSKEMEDGSPCGEVVSVKTKDLLEKRGTNSPEVMPESML
jgi:hypothetical protein